MRHPIRMEEEVVTTADLLTAWRDATRAAELAERLARMAAEAAETADRSALASAEIAKLAERAATAAERAALSARRAAQRAAQFAAETRDHRLQDADEVVIQVRAEEAAAQDAYHRSESAAHGRHGQDEGAEPGG